MKQFLKKAESVYIRHVGRLTVLSLCLSLAVFAGCAARQPEPLKSVDTGMGTIISQTIYMTRQGEKALRTQKENAENAGKSYIAEGDAPPAEEILSLIGDMEQNLLSWRISGSEICYVNSQAADGQDRITLSRELSDIMETCLLISAASDGAFDVTLGQVTRLWDIDKWSGSDKTGYELPIEEELLTALSQSGSRFVSLQGNTLYLSKQVQLDLGAVGKGTALQVILKYLQEKEAQGKLEGAVISVGGSILTYGRKPDGGSWKVGIINPGDTSRNLGYLDLSGQWCISTSGDYERFVEVDEVRYHHIMDPATGYPACSDVSSVTILSKDGLLSDALSTACFVLGVDKGEKLAEEFGAEALFVDKNGQLHMTEGMEEYFRLSN